jgi:Tol biopolymer transport system component/predicted Ser/Thr protein kinase
MLAQTDPELRREVESLLARLSGCGFLDRPAIQNAPDLLEDSTVTQLAAGVCLGPYRIESKLGEGGMGEVFRAVDTRLDRAVAIKITHERFTVRFDREARAISSLNHPNICALYDVGPNYLVMELVEGETISAWLKRGPMPIEMVRYYGAQIAAALAEAHAKGIVHRDLKPGNIMIAKSGAKVLDFGLARSVGPDETVTASRMVMGTPAYMAPEQREGKPADIRSDIYSFGCVLYEMSTGGRIGMERRRIPSRKLERIVNRCLEPDAARRWQSAAELERELAAPGKRRQALYAAAALAVLMTGALLAWRFGGPHRPVTSASEYIQLTNFNDSATAPALSPDGRMVTFFRGGAYFLGSGQIYIKLLPDGESKQLTFDSTQKYDPVFTPDASRVAYTGLNITAGGFETWTVPVLGGPPARLMVNAAGLSWIGPDRILFSEIMAGSILHMGIVTAKESRAEERAIYFPANERAMAHYSWLSPDRDWVLIVEMNGGVQAWQRCRVVPMDGSSAGVPVGPQGACTAAAWSPDGRWMYLNVEVDGSTHLWRQRWRGRAPQGNPEQITFGPTEEEGLAVTPDGKSLIASVGVRQSSVWTHDAAGDHAVSLEGSAWSPWLSPDGKRLYYLLRKSTSSDVSELWRRDLLSGKSDPVLTGQRIVDYDVSRDEARVAFTVQMGGESQIFVAAADRSSPPRLVVRGGDQVSFGAGQLFFRQLGGKADYLARVQEDGSGLARILEAKTTEVDGVSPDGEWATAADLESMPGEYLVGVRSHAQRKICAGVCFLKWSADGKYLYVSPISRFSASESTLPTYIIPIPHGVELLDLPASGIDLESKEQPAGIQSIPRGNMSPGADPQTYAFTTAAFQGNLFRIPLH